MKLIAWFAFSLLMSVSAHAASFDCRKAATRVEKMICNDAELSRLDEELGSAYKSALQDINHAAILKESQKQWLKDRDSYVDSEYFKKSYIKRLSLLKLPISTTKIGKPIIARNDHSASLLSNGKVLIVGGRLDNDQYLDSAELYDPNSSRFTTTGNLVSHSRGFALVTQLTNGKVLVAGGEAPYEGQDPINFLFSAELYDPTLGAFKETGSFVPSQGAHRLEGPTTATLLGNGKVLFAPLFMEDGTAQLYDPSKGRFEVTGSFSEKRAGSTATLLLNGKVLFAGGRNNLAKNLVSAELFDPITNTFKPTGSLSKARIGHTATLLQNGKVLVAGGYSKDTPIASAELYDPATGHFSVTGNMISARSDHTATVLQNGNVLIAGGQGNEGESVVLEIYDPITGLFKSAGRLIEAGHRYTATLLPNGNVLFVGGGAAELYEPITSK